ncbi:MAG TPA: prephenate dehydratase [Bryobacteraceae bacterium]|jgi:prephenate dehydratase|nr:prephenate dehydratase [Bryobacteraceae bacterium]
MKCRVAFQGEPGAFSQIAALRFGGEDCIPVPMQSFEEIFISVQNGKNKYAAIPIENTLHGSVHENYDHLLKYDLPIRAETFVRIVHNLIAPPDVRFSQLKRVYSHPVALNQCRHFFEVNPQIERTPFYDTAGSVKMVMDEGLKDAGAIASAEAARIYGAKILKKSIEDDRENYTRFVMLEKPARGRRFAKPDPAIRYKTTVVFTTRNTPGALFRALSAFALRDISLTKIESRPLRGKPWEYLFYLDFLGHADDPVCKNALGHLAELADMLRILGCYPGADLKTTAK